MHCFMLRPFSSPPSLKDWKWPLTHADPWPACIDSHEWETFKKKRSKRLHRWRSALGFSCVNYECPRDLLGLGSLAGSPWGGSAPQPIFSKNILEKWCSSIQFVWQGWLCITGDFQISSHFKVENLEFSCHSVMESSHTYPHLLRVSLPSTQRPVRRCCGCVWPWKRSCSSTSGRTGNSMNCRWSPKLERFPLQ